VDYYGTPTPLQQLASLQNPEARTLIITPYDKTALKDIERAIVNFPNLGATPSNDGTIIRVTMPELTEERRKEYVKIVRAKSEDAKVVVRNLRRKAKDDLDALKSEVGDDEVARAEKELEALTKTHTDAIDEALKRKEAELLEV
jgi:ribosome recycling factor